MASPRGLHALSRLHGLQTAYRANDGARVGASPEGLMATLRAMGVPVREAADIPPLLDHRRRELAERVLEPVVVAWQEDGGGGKGPVRGELRLRLPERLRDARVEVRIGLEEGSERSWTAPSSSLEAVEEAEADGRAYLTVRTPLPELPTGYHDLEVEARDARWDALLMVAPGRAADWRAVADRPAWGVIAPLYALWEEGRPSPDYGLLDRLAERIADAGGSVVGTLPVLAAFLDRPYEPSPYAPASRLFWNEVYTDPGAAPGAGDLPADVAGAGPAPSPPRAGGGRGDATPRWFDPRATMAAKRPALEALARGFFEGDPATELAAFRARNPRADDYARFRALTARLGEWGAWPDRLRARDVRPGDYDEEEARYHLYVQWLAERQLAEATERAGSRGVSLYLDLPLGVHPGGYDVWRDRALFARGASAGAPPDPLAVQGQDWGFPPLRPEAARLDRHGYFIACIRKHLRFAKVLRVDHAMQLHRMFWVPDGDAREGVYVRYPAEELYAVLCLESRRAGAVIVGEDLGTVPSAVRRGMKRHGLFGMYVAQFELREAAGREDAGREDAKGGEAAKEGEDAKGREDAKDAKALVPGPVPAGAVASIGTHDTPTFAGWWRGRDAEIRGEEGILGPEEVAAEVAGRARLREELVRGLRELQQRRLEPPRRHDGATTPRPGVGGEAEVEVEVEFEAEPEVAVVALSGLHRHMGRSGAGLVLASMEDLWLEREPQNVPGTTGERNWRRRSARPLEALDTGRPAALLEELDEARRDAE